MGSKRLLLPTSMPLFMPSYVPHLPPTRSIMPDARMANGPLLQILPSSRAPSTTMAYSDSFLAALPLAPLSVSTVTLSSHCAYHAALPLIPAAVVDSPWKNDCSKSSWRKDIQNHSCSRQVPIGKDTLQNYSRNILFRVLMCPLRHLQQCQQRPCPFLIQLFLQPLQMILDPSHPRAYSSMARAMPPQFLMMPAW